MTQLTAVALADLSFAGKDLVAPESVLTFANGDVLVTNRACGATWIRPDGTQRELGDRERVREFEMIPNGIAVSREGRILMANVGPRGGVWEVLPGDLRPYFMELDGKPIPSTNFVAFDERDRMWITISTRQLPRDRAFDPKVADGYIILVDEGRARVVADGLSFTNELRIDRKRELLYVNETYAPRMTCFRLAADGTLSGRREFGTFPGGSYPDGLELDEDGNVWTTAIVSNGLFRFAPDGTRTLVLEDNEPAVIAAAHAAFLAGKLVRPLIDSDSGRLLHNISSVAFGGADRKTVYLGCLLGSRLATFRTDVAGEQPIHWNISLHEVLNEST